MATGQSQFPTALDTIANLLGATNNFQTTLLAPLAPSDVSASLATVAGLESAGALTIIEVVSGIEVTREVVFYGNLSGSDAQGLIRGADGTPSPTLTYSAGAIVRQNNVAAYHKANRNAILALETKVGFSASVPNGNAQALMTDAAGASAWRDLVASDIKTGTLALARIPALPTSQVTGLDAALALKAPLASPTFTGVPAAPTAVLGTNTTQLATTAFVRAEVAALVAAAPGTLDTLNELATALGDDPNFATTVTTSLAGKQPLDADLTAIAALSADGLLRKSSGVWGMDAASYLTANQTITLSGDVSGSGTTAITTAIGAGVVTNTMLAGSIALSKLAVTGTPDNTNFLRGDGSWQVVTSPVGANPSATVGLSAVNGSATSFMRSDGAPALSQAIAPTWTGAHIWDGVTGTFQRNSIGVTSTDGLILQNQTAAAAGAQQFSPRLRLTGQGWKTNATAASQAVDWLIENQPVQGAANPSTNLVFAGQVNTGGYANVLALNFSAGNATGISVTSAAAGSGVTIGVTSSGSNESLILTSKGTGSVILPTGARSTPALVFTGATTMGFWNDSNTSIRISSGGTDWVQFTGAGISLGAVNTNKYDFGGNVALQYLSSGIARISNSSTGAGQLLLGTSTDTADAQLSVYSQSTTRPSLKLRALSGTAASQNMLEVYEAGGTLTTAIQSGGLLTLGGTTGTINTSGTSFNLTVNGTARLNYNFSTASAWNMNAGLVFATDNAYDIGASGATRPRNVFVAGTGTFGGAMTATTYTATSTIIGFSSSTTLRNSSDGVLLLTDAAATSFNRLQFGGTTSSFPALKRSSAALEVRLADDSAFAAEQSLYIRYGSGTPEGAVTAPVGAIYSRTDGGAGTSLYVKESGAGNTGWIAK